MESLDKLNLRAGECSFLEIALVDVRRYIESFAVATDENKKRTVLVFPPFSARNRFLVHTLVRNFFTELSTLSIGSSYGRRTVVYHSSIKPMPQETELDEPIEMQEYNEDNNTNMHRAYRTPSERKAQEKLFESLMPKKKVDTSLRSTQRKQCKRPDIPIYVPKARRGLPNNVASNSSSTTVINTSNSSHITRSSTTPVTNSKTQDDLSDQLCSKEVKDSSPTQNSNNQQHTHDLSSLDTFNFVNVSSDAVINVNNDHQASFNNSSSQILESLPSSSSQITSSNTPVTNSRIQDDPSDKLCSKDSSPTQKLNNQQHTLDLSSLDSFNFVNVSSDAIINNSNNVHQSSQISKCLPCSLLNDVNKIVESSMINQDESETIIGANSLDNCGNALIGLPQCLFDKPVSIYAQNSMPVNLTDFQIPNCNSNNTADNLPELQEFEKLVDQKITDNILEVVNENNMNEFNELHYKMPIENDIANTSDVELLKEYNSNSPNYCLNDSSISGPLTDGEENNSTSINEKPSYQQGSKLDDNKIDMNKKKEKNKKKKKILDLNECSWEDLYDKEEDYIHPLLVQELASSIGKVQVKCTQEDYRSHQTVEERSGNGECVIEVYGFSSDLKTVDLMNQFAAFRKNHFEIVWVDDTHALAVFESPNLADRALNTPFALVKTRPLKNAIKESKLKADTVAPLPITRPKTCTAMARRLVSSALGLKLNVSADLLNKERTMLASAKEKKIRDAQQKHDIWNNES